MTIFHELLKYRATVNISAADAGFYLFNGQTTETKPLGGAGDGNAFLVLHSYDHIHNGLQITEPANSRVLFESRTANAPGAFGSGVYGTATRKENETVWTVSGGDPGSKLGSNLGSGQSVAVIEDSANIKFTSGTNTDSAMATGIYYKIPDKFLTTSVTVDKVYASYTATSIKNEMLLTHTFTAQQTGTIFVCLSVDVGIPVIAGSTFPLIDSSFDVSVSLKENGTDISSKAYGDPVIVPDALNGAGGVISGVIAFSVTSGNIYNFGFNPLSTGYDRSHVGFTLSFINFAA